MSNKSKRKTLLLLLLLTSGLQISCSSLITPKVSLADIRVKQIRLLEQEFVLTLRIQNPNDFDLPIKGLNYSLKINNMDFGEGVSNQQIIVSAYGENLYDVRLISNAMNFFSQFRSFTLLNKDSFNYHLSGFISFDSHYPRLPFEKKGSFDLPL